MLNDRLLQFVNIDLHDVKVLYSGNCYESRKFWYQTKFLHDLKGSLCDIILPLMQHSIVFNIFC